MPKNSKPASSQSALSAGGSRLTKAKLMVYSDLSGGAKDIEFMFNPSELSFSRQVFWQSDRGNRSTTLLPKVNFSGVDPYRFTLQNLLFDTYEQKTSVLTEHIDNIKQGVTAKATAVTRPPVYILTWHDTYFHCVMTSLNYRLTVFLPDGTPVKAIVDIALQEVDPKVLPGSSAPGAPSLGGGGRGRDRRLGR
jgi:hypothetical protein